MSKAEYVNIQKQLGAAQTRLSACLVEQENIDRQLDELEWTKDELHQQISTLEKTFYDLEMERDDLEDAVMSLEFDLKNVESDVVVDSKDPAQLNL